MSVDFVRWRKTDFASHFKPRSRCICGGESLMVCYFAPDVASIQESLEQHAKYVCSGNEKPENRMSVNAGRTDQHQAHLNQGHGSTAESHQTCSPFVCIFCDTVFRNLNSLRKHERWRHASVGRVQLPKQFKCSLCGQDFTLFSSLKRHEKTHLRSTEERRNSLHDTNDSEGFKCLNCCLSFGCLSALHQHELIDGCPASLNSDSNNKTKHCDQCGIVFHSSTLLLGHFQKCHGGGKSYPVVRRLDCEICHKPFHPHSLKRHLKTHLAVPVGRPSQVFQASEEITSSFSDVAGTDEKNAGVARVLQQPTDACAEKEHICHTCGRKFARSKTLKFHLYTHTGERPYPCHFPGCSKRFSQSSSRNYHERTHSDATPYICPICGRQFKSKVLVHLHSQVHSTDRPYACSTCGKTFRRQHILRYHEMSHAGNRRFACTVCSKRFMTSRKLKQHGDAVHAKLRPFRCMLCDRTFTQDVNLRTHMRIHTGEKPYICSTCGMRFAHAGTLKGHLKTHSSEKCAGF